MIEAKISDSSVRIWDEEEAEEVHSEHYYGKFLDDDRLELAPVEAMHLVDREIIEVYRDDENLDSDELYEYFSEVDEEFDYKYKAYSDLRERGLIIKSGFKFGAHFRVYPRGVNPYADQSDRERQHTEWVVHAVPETHTLSFQEMSRAVRLAQNIRATMLWAVVDSEGGVTYYEVERFKP